MKGIVAVTLAVLFWPALAAPDAAGTTDPVDPIEAEITVARLFATARQVDFRLNRPVAGIDFGPPVERYRDDAWTIDTPGLALRLHDGTERLLATGEPFDRARLRVSLCSAFPPDNYVPAARFSDGDAALILGFLEGDAVVPAGTIEMRER